MDIHNLLNLILLTLFPALELRASIPYGLLFAKLNVWEVVLVAVVVNVALGLVLFLLLDRLVRFFCRWQFINEIYNKVVARTQRRAKPYVDRFGTIGLALFIAVPLPGSGVWTGALAAHLLGIKFKRFLIADIIGVLIAATIVTALVLGLLNGL